MPFQTGNTLGAKSKKFEQALTRALAAEDYQALRDIADKTLELARGGERWATELIRDTLDGKPAQAMQIEGGETPILTKAIVELIHASGSDAKTPTS